MHVLQPIEYDRKKLIKVRKMASSKQNPILGLLRKVTLLPAIVAQGSGYFPFNIDKNNQVNFSSCGPHFINMIIQAIIGTVCPMFCILNIKLHSELADGWSGTEKFAYGMIFNVINISKGFIRLFSFLRRTKIQNFFQKLNKAMENSMEDLGSQEKIKVTNQLLDTRKRLRIIWVLIFALEAILFPFMIILLIRITSSETISGQPHQASLIRMHVFIAAMAICTITGVLYSSFLYLLVSIIHCIQIGFQVLGPKTQTVVEENNTPTIGIAAVASVPRHPAPKLSASTTSFTLDEMSSSQENNNGSDNDVDEIEEPFTIKTKEKILDDFVKGYMELESVVSDFNETFKYHICIILLGSCSSWILHTFVLLSAFMKEGIHIFGMALLLLWVMLDTAGIVVACTASCRLADEAKNSAYNMRNQVMREIGTDIAYGIKAQIYLNSALSMPVCITPGNYFVLKRSAILSIYAVMTTYVFVVLQFQEAEHYIAVPPGHT